MDPQPPPPRQPLFFQLPNAPATTAPGAASTQIAPQAPPATAESHSANATASSVPQSLNNPPYNDMIYAAITALREKDGSSKRAIAKYIEREYTGLPESHSSLLTEHLNRMKNSGLLVMTKKSYKLPRSDSHSVDDDGSGDSVANASLSPHNPFVESGNAGPKRGRGRPPKPKGVAVTEPVSQSTDDAATAAAVPVTVPIGFPSSSQPNVAADTGAVRRRGRPPKRASNAVNRTPKRLPKSVVVPYATGLSAVGGFVSPRPRGRPKKGTTTALAAVADDPTVVEGKRRGRPPRSSVSGAVTDTKKRPGRPRKNANVARTATESSQLRAEEAYGDLKSKFEFFQARVRHAVGVLKPQLNNETPANVIAAIQDLEDVASVDIDAPLPPRQ